MRHILSFLLLSFATAANADELVLHTFSYHYKNKYEETYTTNYVDENGKTLYSIDNVTFRRYNNVNLGIGYKTDNGWIIGTYKNSYSDRSFYVAKEFMFTNNFGIVIGGASGYKYHTGKSLYPCAAFEYKVRLTDVTTANILFTPPVVRDNMSGVVHLTISERF